MSRAHIGPLAAVLMLSLPGCLGTGQNTISVGRTNYNEVIRDTSNEQLLLNIVRASKQETLQFSEVTAIAASSKAQLSLMSGVSSIGLARARAGSVDGNLGYEESPIVTITPNQGYSLIAQVSKPITTQSIANLANSNWPLVPLLSYTINNLTPAYLDYHRAVNIMRILENYGALIIDAPDENQLTIRASLSGNLTQRALARAYGRDVKDCLIKSDADQHVKKLWSELRAMFGQSSNNLILLKNIAKSPRDNIIQTRSALGAINISQYYPYAFLPDEIYESVKLVNRNSPCRTDDAYYFEGDRNLITQIEADKFWNRLSDGDIGRDEMYYLSRKRAYVLIRKSRSAPITPYVAIQKDGEWYSIDVDDSTSKKNFALLAQIVTIQSVNTEPKPSAPQVVLAR